MNTTKQRTKKLIALICFFVVLSFTFLSLVPHAHTEVEQNCQICSIIENTNIAVIKTTTISSIIQWTLINFLSGLYLLIISLRGETPVGLKVKLSN
jgi:uncharacterized membrane protein